jgi:hypothetical protein
MKRIELGYHYRKVKILLLPGKEPFSLFISFSLSCCASGQALIHLGVQGRLAKKKRSKEKSSQQKTPARKAGRRLVLWQAPALLAIVIL